LFLFFFFSSRRRHTRSLRDWSSDVCSSDLLLELTMRLNMTIDELLHGEIALGYRLARRPGSENGAERLFPLLDDPHVGLRAQLRSEERRVGKECRSRGSACP